MAKSNPTVHFSPLYYFLLEVQTSKPTTKGGPFRWKSFAHTHTHGRKSSRHGVKGMELQYWLHDFLAGDLEQQGVMILTLSRHEIEESCK